MNTRREIPQSLKDRLPVHHPDESLWSGISSKLEELEAQDVYEKRLANLPLHRPDANTWNMILRRMQQARVIRIGYWSLGAAASIILLFSIFRVSEITFQPSTQESVLSENAGSISQPFQKNDQPILTDNSASPAASNLPSRTERVVLSSSSAKGSSFVAEQTAYIPEADNGASVRSEAVPIRHLNSRTSTLVQSGTPVRQLALKSSAIKSLPDTPPVKPVKYYDPGFYEKEKSKTGFSLAANYLPETLENGNGTSLFHNMGLTASLGNDNFRVQSGLGLTYNAEHRVYDVNYTQFIPITSPGPGSDSTYTSIMEATGASELEGTERHQYLTYDLGVGKKLFSLGKMTTWISTGAGIAVRLDDASLKEETIKTINQHNNSQVNAMDLEIPDYNGVNINLMAGLDFNYRILERLSISFAPVSRFYLKPVLEKNGSTTDSFSMGFRSGMRFDF